MKQIITNYSFSVSAKTITLSDFGSSHPVDLKRLYLITDVTTNKILYSFADSTVSSASISSYNVITLSALQGGESNGDSLQVVYEVLSTDPTYEVPLLPSNAAQETGGNLATIATNTAGLATSSNLTSGTQQTKLTDGTNIANVVAGDTGYNGLAIGSGTKTYTFTTSATGVQTLLANTPTEGYSWVEVVLTGAGGGLAWTAQVSNTSGGTYTTIPAGSWKTPGTIVAGLGTTVNILYHTALYGNYFQFAVSAMTSGTTAGYIILHATPYSGVDGSYTTAAQSGGWTVGGSTINTTGTITSSSSNVTSGSYANNSGFASFTVSGTYSGVTFGVTETNDNGTTYYNVPVYDGQKNTWVAPGTSITPTNNSSNIYWVPLLSNLTGTFIKVLASAYTSGTANVRFNASGIGNFPGSTMAQIMDAAGNNRGGNVDANNALLVDPGTATGVSAPANAMYNGAQARTSLPTAATSGNLVGFYADKFGRQVTVLQTTRDLVSQQSTTITSSTSSTTVVSAAGAGVYADIASITFVNSSATATLVTFSDGTNSYYFYAPAGDMRGAVYQVPLAATTANTAWTVTCGTSVASLYVTVEYLKNQ